MTTLLGTFLDPRRPLVQPPVPELVPPEVAKVLAACEKAEAAAKEAGSIHYEAKNAGKPEAHALGVEAESLREQMRAAQETAAEAYAANGDKMIALAETARDEATQEARDLAQSLLARLEEIQLARSAVHFARSVAKGERPQQHAIFASKMLAVRTELRSRNGSQMAADVAIEAVLAAL
jgi:hypothetical protein